MPYRLVFISGPQKGKRLTVQQGAVVIGRDPDCAIAIADDEVSRRHAVIEERPQGVYVRDLGSMNGVVVGSCLVLTLAIVLAASWIPARRAARLDLLPALKYE
mgnify:CR=1 FL=1